MLAILSHLIATHAVLQFEQQLAVVYRFLDVVRAVFVLVAGDVLDDVALKVADPVGVDVLDRLDGEPPVVPAAYLDA